MANGRGGGMTDSCFSQWVSGEGGHTLNCNRRRVTKPAGPTEGMSGREREGQREGQREGMREGMREEEKETDE